MNKISFESKDFKITVEVDDMAGITSQTLLEQFLGLLAGLGYWIPQNPERAARIALEGVSDE